MSEVENIIEILESEIERLKTIEVLGVKFQKTWGRFLEYGNENDFQQFVKWVNDDLDKDLLNLPLLTLFRINISDTEITASVRLYKDDETRVISVEPRLCTFSPQNKKRLIDILVPHIGGWKFV